MSSNILNMSDLANNDISNLAILADTSFIWQLYGAEMGSRQFECQEFLRVVVENDSILVVTPTIEKELRNVVIKELLKKESDSLGLDWHRRKEIITNTPNFMKTVNENYRPVVEVINENPSIIRLNNDGDFDLAMKIAEDFNMDQNDSIILSTLETEGMSHFVSLDRDYTNYDKDNFTFITNRSNYLKIVQDNKDTNEKSS